MKALVKANKKTKGGGCIMSAIKKMNIVDIENGLEMLFERQLTPEEYGKELVLLFSSSNTLKRISTSKANIPDHKGGILWREKMHYAPCEVGKLNEVLEALKLSPKTLKAKVRLVIVNDGIRILVYDRKYDELSDNTIESIKDEPQLFLPLAGQESFRREVESEVDIKATGKLAKLYDELIANNPDWLEDEKRHTLNHFMTQIIFCLFAEDTSIFPKDIFTKTLRNRAGNDGQHATEVITNIFEALDIELGKRGDMPSWLSAFPYVNGGLYSGEVSIPVFTAKAYRFLMEAAALDWKNINPDILGSSIQAIVDPSMRGSLGMHYTSVPNILKTLEPLFLNQLRDELFRARHSKKHINSFLQRLSKTILADVACGSGNFLVIAYRELRKLELQAMDALRDINAGASLSFGFSSVVSLNNFYGIEYADFAAETAKLALWIAEYQQNARFSAAFGENIPALPLNNSANILCANALRVNWEEFCNVDDCNHVYLVSNPPYLGARSMSKEQKGDMKTVFEGVTDGYNNIDYVSAWFWKSVQFCNSNQNRSFALVSTNTLVQGIHIGKLWSVLFSKNMEISFAYKSFHWSNNASDNAGVTCVIVGMRNVSEAPKYIFEKEKTYEVTNINPYLLDMENHFVIDSSKPLNGLPPMNFGNMPNDGGALLLSAEEKNEILSEHPSADSFIRRIYGSSELIKNLERYCIWIDDSNKEEALKHRMISDRVELCRNIRNDSKRTATNKLAEHPYKFGEVRQYSSSSTIAIPRVSSENRKYLPVAILTKGEIISDRNFGIYDGPLWLFALIASRLHWLWISTVCVRLRNDFSYSNTLGWNTFPVPSLSESQTSLLEQSARNIILTRENHFPDSIAVMYDKDKMPDDLLEAHLENDKLLESFYSENQFKNDTERLKCLFGMYQEMVSKHGK